MEVVQKIEDSYNRIVRLYQSAPVAALLEPVLANGWSVKDLLAHIAAWEWRLAGMLNLAQETNMPFRAQPDSDALNQEFYEERRRWSWEEVEYDLREAHEALLQAIQALPPDRLADEMIQKTIAQETWQHYDSHLADLQEWREQLINRPRQVGGR